MFFGIFQVNLYRRVLITLVGLSLVPLIILGSFFIVNEIRMIDTISTHVTENRDQIVTSSTDALNSLGMSIIRYQSIAVAREIGLYIKAHPEKTISDLKHDPEFLLLTNQTVGETGYFGIHERESLITDFHPNPKRLGETFEPLIYLLPDFYIIVKNAQRDGEAGGFYDWIEPDGSHKKKYLYISTVCCPTADNITLQVSATTYLDEFSAPATRLSDTIADQNQNLIQTLTDDISRAGNVTIIICGLTIAGVFLFGLLLGRSITAPLISLITCAQRIGSGELDGEIPGD